MIFKSLIFLALSSFTLYFGIINAKLLYALWVKDIEAAQACGWSIWTYGIPGLIITCLILFMGKKK